MPFVPVINQLEAYLSREQLQSQAMECSFLHSLVSLIGNIGFRRSVRLREGAIGYLTA